MLILAIMTRFRGNQNNCDIVKKQEGKKGKKVREKELKKVRKSFPGMGIQFIPRPIGMPDRQPKIMISAISLILRYGEWVPGYRKSLR